MSITHDADAPHAVDRVETHGLSYRLYRNSQIKDKWILTCYTLHYLETIRDENRNRKRSEFLKPTNRKFYSSHFVKVKLLKSEWAVTKYFFPGIL